MNKTLLRNAILSLMFTVENNRGTMPHEVNDTLKAKAQTALDALDEGEVAAGNVEVIDSSQVGTLASLGITEAGTTADGGTAPIDGSTLAGADLTADTITAGVITGDGTGAALPVIDDTTTGDTPTADPVVKTESEDKPQG